MKFSTKNIPYAATGSFAKIVTDYVEGKDVLKPFYTQPVSLDGVKAAIAERKKYPTNRQLLVTELKKQYQQVNTTDKVNSNIDKLLSENTFTITTAHQPNIFTGHLYSFIKYCRLLNLLNSCKKKFPEMILFLFFIWVVKMLTWKSSDIFIYLAKNMNGKQIKPVQLAE